MSGDAERIAAGKREKRMRPDDVRGAGEVRFMAAAEGYVMARRPHCSPFIVSQKDWLSWPIINGGQHGE